MITLLFEDYKISAKPNTFSLSVKTRKKGQVVLNKDMKVTYKILGHFNNLPACIEKIIEHKLLNQTKTIQLEDYIKSFNNSVQEIKSLLKT